MKNKELLYELIHSLSKSEKRYFSVFTTKQGEKSNYVKLFNAIRSQKKYDENALIDLFKNEDFVRQFSVAKNYLINLVLKSLSIHHQKAKKSIELNSFLTEIEILFWKGLYKLAYKKIQQAKKIAQKYDMTHYLLLINYWDRRIENYMTTKMLNETVVKDTQKFLSEYNQQLEMSIMIKQMEKISRSTIKRTLGTSAPVKNIFNQDLMKLKENDIINFHAKLDYCFVKGTGYAFLGNKEKEFYYKKRAFELLEENPHQIKENPTRYASAINNMILYYYFQGLIDKIPPYLEKLDQVELKFNHTKISFINAKHNLNLRFYMYHKETTKVEDLLLEMESWYNANMTYKSTVVKMISEYNISLAYFYLNKTKNCLKWCNSCFKLFDMKVKKNRHDLAVSVVLLQLLLYFDLKHFDLALKNIDLVISIATKNKYGKSEISIFKLLRKMIVSKNIHDYPQKINEIIKAQDAGVINMDKDILLLWIKKNKHLHFKT